jgi:RHS repeat-associated protein
MKVVGSDTIRYVMGLGEHSSISGWRALYVYLGSEKLVEYRSNSTRFFHNDHLGTTKAVTDHTGAVLERWDHYPFGEEWVSGLSGDRYRYTGHLRDEETGNDYAGARYYANARGRWLSVDPLLGDISNPQRLNRYSYVGNDPVNIVDPDGMEWKFARTLHYFWPEAELWIVGEIWTFTRSGPGGAGGTGAFGEGGRGGGLPVAARQRFMSKADFKDFLSERLSARCREYLKSKLGMGILDRMATDVDKVSFWRLGAPSGVADVKMTDLGEGSFAADTIGEYWDRAAGRADAMVVRNVEGNLLPHVLLGATFGYKSSWEQGMIMTREMLHYSTGWGDVRLADELRLVPKGYTDTEGASGAIRNFMHKHDCDLESYRGSFP